MEWKGIESAPKNGDYYLVCGRNVAVCLAFWDEDVEAWVEDGHPATAQIIEPEYWLPIPEAPEHLRLKPTA